MSVTAGAQHQLRNAKDNADATRQRCHQQLTATNKERCVKPERGKACEPTGQASEKEQPCARAEHLRPLGETGWKANDTAAQMSTANVL
jgi:hypothetical protein